MNADFTPAKRSKRAVALATDTAGSVVVGGSFGGTIELEGEVLYAQGETEEALAVKDDATVTCYSIFKVKAATTPPVMLPF